MNPIVPSLQKGGRAAEPKTVDALAELQAVAPPSDLPDPQLTENAVKVLERRYLKKDANSGKICETPRECSGAWRRAWRTPT